MRYRLRTLLILLAVLPPFLAWWGWPALQRVIWPPQNIDVSVNTKKRAVDIEFLRLVDATDALNNQLARPASQKASPDEN